MKNMYKILSILIVSISYFSISKAQEIPSSFADLAEKLMPSVVNISTTTTVTTRSNPLPFEFPPGSPFEDMFGSPQQRQTSALVSPWMYKSNSLISLLTPIFFKF